MTAAGDPSPSGAARPRGRPGWLGHLLILSGWIAAFFASAVLQKSSGHRHVPLGSIRDVAWRLATQTPCFGAVCAGAWLCSRATAAQWRLCWRGFLRPVWCGFLYSLALRVGQFVLVLVPTAFLQAFHLLNPRTMGLLRPHTENAVSLQALAHDPVFVWLGMPLISIYAGLTEEIWRGGMLAGFSGTFPGLFTGRAGSWAAIVPTAMLFGLAHLYMGWAAVVFAMFTGLGLGAICVRHGTIWEAVFAHAFFDAASLTGLVWLAHHHPRLPGTS